MKLSALIKQLQEHQEQLKEAGHDDVDVMADIFKGNNCIATDFDVKSCINNIEFDDAHVAFILDI